MLNLWKRHSPNCSQKRRTFKKCGCVVWVSGSLHGQKMRKSLGIRNWEAAQKIVRDWEARIDGGTVSVSQAFERFIADCTARHLRDETIGKYRLLQREMKAEFGGRPVDAIGLHELSLYRESWRLSAISCRKKIERLRTFFRFCIERGWTEKNPAALLKPPRAAFSPTLPFSDEELKKISGALETYPDRPVGRRKQVLAFVLMLQHSGLRIRDAACLSKDNLSEGKLLLYTQKTGQPVWLPLSGVVIEAIGGLPARPFWSGNGNPKSCVADWQRSLKKLFALSGIEGHAHRFRDTFAVNLLRHGVSLEDVSILLGHSSIKVTEKHYAPWVKVRQDRLEQAVRRTWDSF